MKSFRFTDRQEAEHLALVLKLIGDRPGGAAAPDLQNLVPFSRPILYRYFRALVGRGKIRSSIVRRQRRYGGSLGVRVYFLAESESEVRS